MPPLPPLSPDNTRRAYIRYTSGTRPHTLMLRIPAGVSAGTLDDALNEVISYMTPLMAPADSVIRVDESAAGSNVTFPLFPVALVGTAGGTVDTPENRSAFMSMTGKGTDGRLLTHSFYSLLMGNFTTVRQPIGVIAAPFADWYTSIDANSYGLAFRTIGGAVPTYNAYLNMAKSAYWQREQR